MVRFDSNPSRDDSNNVRTLTARCAASAGRRMANVKKRDLDFSRPLVRARLSKLPRTHMRTRSVAAVCVLSEIFVRGRRFGYKRDLSCY